MGNSEIQELDVDLTHYIDIMLRRRWIVIATWTIIVLSTALIVFTMRPLYDAKTLLVIEKERGSNSAIVNDGTMVENNNEDYYQTQYRLIKSDSLMQKIYDDLDLRSTEDFKKGLEQLQKAVTVSPIPRSRLLYINAVSHSPELAARVVNSLARAYVEQNLNQQLFISKEVLQALQLREDVPDARAVYDALPAVVNNQLLQTLKAEYARSQAKAADLSVRYTAKHPIMAGVRSDVAALEAQIRLETERIVRSLKTELSGQLKGNNVRVVDLAKVPERPFRPRKGIALVTAFLGGLLGGFGLALLVELMDQSVRTQEDVETKLHLSFLGHIPMQRLPEREPVYQPLLTKESSVTSEAFRNLRTMVDFARVSDKTNAILVTSSVQGEGKTYVAANLAVVLAQLGESVLLVDGDLRRPSQHKTFGHSKEKGLSDFLATGTRAEDVREYIGDTAVPNLKLLPCGPIPPNPAELLNTPRLPALTAWLQSAFDRVIIDCTPIFPISDTMLWARHVRSAVFVVRYGKTRAPLVRTACRRLGEGNIKTLGAVINCASPSGLAYSAYGYYYQQYYHAYEATSTSRRA